MMSADLSKDWNAYLRWLGNPSYTDREYLRFLIHGSVLEVGCGVGAFCRWCAEELGLNIVGLDPSSEAIQRAEQAIPSAKFVVGYAEGLPFSAHTFDTVVSLEVVEHLPQPEKFFQEAKRVLKEGGTLIVQTPQYPLKRFYDFLHWIRRTKKNLADDPTHISPFTLRALQQMAEEAGFVVEALVGRNILGENKISSLARWKRTKLGRHFSQKIILVAHAGPSSV